jgi:hypothetical protein
MKIMALCWTAPLDHSVLAILRNTNVVQETIPKHLPAGALCAPLERSLKRDHRVVRNAAKKTHLSTVMSNADSATKQATTVPMVNSSSVQLLWLV